MEAYILLVLGAFLGAALSMLGGYINVKHSSGESKRNQEVLRLLTTENATKRLITKLKSSEKMINPLISAKENMPPELTGAVPIIEHTIEPIDWVNDLSIISSELDNDSFEKLLSYFTALKRCDDVILRTWELRASGINFQVQLQSYWMLLDNCRNSNDELDILNKLLESIKQKNQILNNNF
jgi:hypothetical protein